VHPTQLYEALLLAILAWALIRWRRAGVDDHTVLGRYLLVAGGIRFGIEFVRINAKVAGPFTLAQLISASLLVVGVWILVRTRASCIAT
jgi:prolipoprotein diacylglyceryltransferase